MPDGSAAAAAAAAAVGVEPLYQAFLIVPHFGFAMQEIYRYSYLLYSLLTTVG